MDEIKEATKDTAQETDQTSTSEDETTSKTTPTYTKETERKAVSDALSEQGRVHKAALEPITQERDTFKTKAEQAEKIANEATATLEETRGHITTLEGDIEVLEESQNDPIKLSTLRKELRTAKLNVRQEVKDETDANTELKRTLEGERLQFAEKVAHADLVEFDGELARLVDDYDGDTTANFNKLKTACDKAGIKTKEGAEAIAELSFTKKVEEPNLLDDSGVTTGGGSGIPTTKEGLVKWAETHTQAEYEEKAPLINKMMREGKIK